MKRFAPSEGLGPLFNVTFCAACHEKPVFGGGGASLSRFLHPRAVVIDGWLHRRGPRNGILSSYGIGPAPTRPIADEKANTFALRNPVPFFGIGLLAEIPEANILANADPDDKDNDGISGRPNYDRGFVGRFGLKAQTVSIEGFIRGPIFNHVGITTDPLTSEQRKRLPVPSAVDEDDPRLQETQNGLTKARFHQAAAPSEPLTDDDDIPDPEMDGETLFQLVSWAMLLAAPAPEPPTELTLKGRDVFLAVGCDGCHVPELEGPRGLIAAYTDLLLHDMGEDLADTLEMGVAEGSEFRTAPLWGVSAVGPYLHDGRADTLDDAIRMHGGEAVRSRDAYLAQTETDRAALIEFLLSLGGREIRTPGLIPPNTPRAAVGELGGTLRKLTSKEEEDAWQAGRDLFDRDVFLEEGLGPVFNGDNCRACHFDPVPGGAGPLGVNAMFHGRLDEDGIFSILDSGITLPKLAVLGSRRPEGHGGDFFESRQTPTLLGIGLLNAVASEVIVAGQDKEDDDGDGVRGIAHILEDGRLGRFGWKANVPNIAESCVTQCRLKWASLSPLSMAWSSEFQRTMMRFPIRRSTSESGVPGLLYRTITRTKAQGSSPRGCGNLRADRLCCLPRSAPRGTTG